MAWSGGTYTKGNAGTGGWSGDAAGGIGIEAGRHDTQDNDFQDGINNCLTKDGQNTPTANLPMNGYKHTNVADASLANQYMAFGQISNGTTTVNVGAITGTTVTAASGGALLLNGSQFSNDTTPAVLRLQKSKSATIGTNAIVANNDGIGRIDFNGANGSSYNSCARIVAEIDGTPGASSDMPGRLIFATTPDGTGIPTERVRITSSGDVGVNVTPSGERFHVRGIDTGSSNRAFTASNSANADLFYVRNDGLILTGTAASSPYNNTIASAANVFVSTSGSLHRSTSSLKYKKDIENMSYGLADVLNLRPVTFAPINGTDPSERFAGLIAEEVDAAGLKEFVQYAEDGTPDALNYANMVALALKAIQELKAENTALEARVAALENA